MRFFASRALIGYGWIEFVRASRSIECNAWGQTASCDAELIRRGFFGGRLLRDGTNHPFRVPQQFGVHVGAKGRVETLL